MVILDTTRFAAFPSDQGSVLSVDENVVSPVDPLYGHVVSMFAAKGLATSQ